MAKKGEKILTRNRVEKLGFDKVSIITADMLDGYTSIGYAAFCNCSSLTSVTISNSVTNIGDYAFWRCSDLTSVTIPNSVTSIGKDAFYKCRSLTSVTIPNSVTRIGDGAFRNCSGLTSVTIGNGVTSIGVWAFSGCSSLTSVTIPNSVTSIEYEAFCGCTGLTSVTIGNSVTSIGSSAFSGCSRLTSVTIPNSVTSVGRSVFYKCNFKQEKRTDGQGRVIAYKGFNADMTCLLFQYKDGETYEIKGEPILCRQGFHACLNPMDCFGYYSGKIGKVVMFHEVYIEGVSDKKYDGDDDSKVVAKKITIGREISLSEMADIASGRK